MVCVVPECYLLCSVFSHQAADDTGDEDHDDDTVENLVGHQVLSGSHFEFHAHHDHGDGTGRMGAGQSEHHVTFSLGQTEQQT